VKHLLTFFSAIILLPCCLFAQSNYKPGYVVTLKGDTIKGFIDYKEWGKNPKQISFKNNLNAANHENFTTNDINAFVVTDYEYYKRFVAHVSQGQVEMSNVKQGADTSYITDTVFLRVLTQGPQIALFSYSDKIKTRYYIADMDNAVPQELVYRVYYSLENSARIQIQNGFRNQLAYLARKYVPNDNKLQMEISDAGYSDADLLKIAREINGDKGREFTLKSGMGTRWYAGIGITNNNLSFMGAISYPNNSSTYPKIEAGLDVFTNKSTRLFFFRLGVSLTENSHSFSSPVDDLGNSYSLSNVIQHNVSILPQLGYNIYNSERFKWFVIAGPSINISFYNNYYTEQTFDNVINAYTNEFPDLFKKWITFQVKTGIAVNKRIEIYAGYTFQTTLTDDYVTFAGRVSTYEAGINYLFGK